MRKLVTVDRARRPGLVMLAVAFLGMQKRPNILHLPCARLVASKYTEGSSVVVISAIDHSEEHAQEADSTPWMRR